MISFIESMWNLFFRIISEFPKLPNRIHTVMEATIRPLKIFYNNNNIILFKIYFNYWQIFHIMTFRVTLVRVQIIIKMSKIIISWQKSKTFWIWIQSSYYFSVTLYHVIAIEDFLCEINLKLSFLFYQMLFRNLLLEYFLIIVI